MANYSRINCHEKLNSKRENWTGEGSTASVSLICNWSDRYELVSDLLKQTPATPYPYNGQTPVQLYVASAQVVNLQDEAGAADGQSFRYNTAEVEVTYTVNGLLGGGGGGGLRRDPTSGEEVFVEDTLEPMTEFHTMNHEDFSWSDTEIDPLKEDEAPVVQEKGLMLKRRITGLSSLHSSILSLPGTVNIAAFTPPSLGITFNAEELLFLDPVINKTYTKISNVLSNTTATVATFDITLSFGYKKGGWNLWPNVRLRTVGTEGPALAFIELKKPVYAPHARDAAGTGLFFPFKQFKPYIPFNYSAWLW